MGVNRLSRNLHCPSAVLWGFMTLSWVFMAPTTTCYFACHEKVRGICINERVPSCGCHMTTIAALLRSMILPWGSYGASMALQWRCHGLS